MQRKPLYIFGNYRLDAEKRVLLRDGQYVSLQQKTFETLLALVERHGEIAEKTDLMAIIWPSTYVEEVNLAKNVSQLRKILAESDSSREFIETISKRGYRFVCPVQVITQSEKEAASPSESEPIESVIAHPESDSTSAVVEKNTPVADSTVSPKPRWKWLAVLALLVTVPGIAAYRWWHSRPPLGWNDMQISRLTSTGDAFEAALSPNGEYLAYISGVASYQSLLLKNLKTNQETTLINKAESRFRGLAFSPDGELVYYSMRANQTGEFTLFRVPLQGGEPQRLLSGVDSVVSFSPDGQRIAFVHEISKSGAGISKIIISRADGSEARDFVQCALPETYSVDGLSWSPDGKMLALAKLQPVPDFHFKLQILNLADGKEQMLGTTNWAWLMRVGWMPDQRSLVAIGRLKNGTTNNQVWQVSYPAGELKRVSNDLNSYRNLSLMPDAKQMVSVQTEIRSNLWIVPADRPQEAFSITKDSGNQNGYNGIDCAPNGRIVFTSTAKGQHQLWTCQADGSDLRQLTNDTEDNDHFPSVSFDGKHIAYSSARAGGSHVWRIDIDGGNLRELTHGTLDLKPSYAFNQNWMAYSSEVQGQRILKKLLFDGDEISETVLTDHVAEFPMVSPDGQWIVCAYKLAPNTPYKPALIPSTPNAAPVRLLDLPEVAWPGMRWHPNGKALTFLMRQDGSVNVWQYKLDEGTLSQLTNFQNERTYSFAWSRDGRYLVCARGTNNQDVVVFDRKL